MITIQIPNRLERRTHVDHVFHPINHPRFPFNLLSLPGFLSLSKRKKLVGYQPAIEMAY